MHFALSQEISEDIYNKASIITSTSMFLKDYFKDRSYGVSVETLIIGIICIHPKFDFFFQPRAKYSKSKKLCEYDIKLDHGKFKISNDSEIQGMLVTNIMDSLDIIDGMGLIDFSVEQFRNDLRKCFETMS
jgi:hypothetical protein